MSVLNKSKLVQIPSGYKVSKLFSQKPTNGAGDLTFSRSTTGTRVNENGLIETVAINTPRLDFTGGGCGKALFEPQRTNLLEFSDDYTQSYWGKSDYTAIANSIISPSGNVDASLIQEDTYTSSIPTLVRNVSLITGTYTYSFYTKKSVGRYLGINFGSGAERVRTNFDFDTETFKTKLLTGATTAELSFKKIGDFYRIIVTATFPSTISASAALLLLETDTYPFFAFQDSANRSFYLWRQVVTKGSFVTSPIYTSGSTVTRAKDESITTGLSDKINSEEGVFMVGIQALADDGTNRFISLSDGTTGDNISIRLTSSSNTVEVRVRVGGGFVSIMSYIVSDITQINKVAIRYREDDFSLWVNGAVRDTDNIGDTFAANKLNQLSFDNGGAASSFYGKLNELVLADYLTDTQMAELTTL